MAIPENRIGTKSPVELISTDFISATDKTKDLPNNSTDTYDKPIAKSTKKARRYGKKNVFQTNTSTS